MACNDADRTQWCRLPTLKWTRGSLGFATERHDMHGSRERGMVTCQDLHEQVEYPTSTVLSWASSSQSLESKANRELCCLSLKFLEVAPAVYLS